MSGGGRPRPGWVFGLIVVSALAAQEGPASRPAGPAVRLTPQTLDRLFRRLDRDGDGRLGSGELPGPELLRRLDRDGDGFVSRAEARAYLADRPSPGPAPTVPAPASRPGEPTLKAMPESDAARDAAGRGQLFESVDVPGLTDRREGMNGFALADLDGDGLLDIVATYSPPSGGGGRWGAGEKLRVFRNLGGFRFAEHPVRLLDSPVAPDAFGRAQVPNLADFDGDGRLDLFVTRHAQASGGRARAASPGNSLFLAAGAWDVFRDVSAAMGIRNEDAYNRQPSLGDVNGDGWLDIAVGCDNIGNAMGGFPHSRLYLFRPAGEKFAGGRFADIGGTDLVPDFGGFHRDSSRDKAGPDIDLVDLDHDGDLDLVQSYHVDVREPLLPFWPGEYRQGVFCWRNLLAESGEARFAKVEGNGLACAGRLRYDRERRLFVPEGWAPGLPYVSFADADNDGLLDVLAVGPANPGWAPRIEYTAGRFWRNLGNFCFAPATAEAGLTALEWTVGEWRRFFAAPAPRRPGRPPSGGYEGQPGLARLDPAEIHPYFADAVFADFDNDGWIDLVVQDRSERVGDPARAILFMNRGGGVFRPEPTAVSGLDGNGICAEAADLDNDGLVDLIFAADPDNTGGGLTWERYESKVYWNTGGAAGRTNHWLRLRISGISHARLIGARVEAREPGTGRLLGLRRLTANASYKSGSPLEAHFGLGREARCDLRVLLPGGISHGFPGVAADRFLELDLAQGRVVTVAGKGRSEP